MMKYEKIVPTNNYPYKIFSFNTKSPDRLVLPHWHESGELLFCLKGSLEINFKNYKCMLLPDDMLFINSNQVHSSRSPIIGQFLAIQFPLKFLDMITEGKYLNEFIFSPHEISNTKEISSRLKYISINFNKTNLSTHISVKAKIYELFALLCDHYIVPVANIREIESNKHLKKMEVINHYISNNFHRELSIEEVSRLFNYNASYFSRMYKKFMGVTYTEYLNSLRLDNAFQMLRDSDQTVLEISLQSGFANVKTFYNVFKKKFHLSPQQYRNKYFRKSN